GPPPAVAPLGPRALSCGALHVRGMLLMSVTVVAVRRALPGQGDAFVARALQLLHEQALDRLQAGQVQLFQGVHAPERVIRFSHWPDRASHAAAMARSSVPAQLDALS